MCDLPGHVPDTLQPVQGASLPLAPGSGLSGCPRRPARHPERSLCSRAHLALGPAPILLCLCGSRARLPSAAPHARLAAPRAGRVWFLGARGPRPLREGVRG